MCGDLLHMFNETRTGYETYDFSAAHMRKTYFRGSRVAQHSNKLTPVPFANRACFEVNVWVRFIIGDIHENFENC